MMLKQEYNEIFIAYVWCFNDEAMQMEDFTNQTALQVVMNVFQLGSF